MKILLFGGTGMVGTSIRRSCAGTHMEIHAPAHREVDVLDLERVRELIGESKPDVIINCVSLVGIDPCERNPELAYKLNSQVPLHLARLANACGAVFVQPSSHAVFSGMKDGYYLESDRPQVMNVYAGSKFLAEQWAQNQCEKHYVVRFPTLFGRRETGAPGFAEKMMVRLREGKEVRVAEDKVDSPTYADDAAELLLRILREEMAYGIYHTANRGACSYFEFIKELAERVQSRSQIHPAKDSDFPSLAYKPLKTAMSSEKLPLLRTWREALTAYIEEERERGFL